MKIRKKETSIGIVGKILNAFSSSEQDTYSADYINTVLEEHYSTEETFTGKYWIDGKKIYRKTYTGTSPQDNSFSVGVTLFNNVTFIDKITDRSGFLTYSSNGKIYQHDIGSYLTSTFFSGIQFTKTTGLLQIFGGTDYKAGTSYELTIEYTKTTE